MFDKFFVGGDVMSSVNNGKFKPVSRVTLLLDDSNAITAGDDTGREIVADCPHATQEMVDNLLASLRGHEYQAYEAGEANIDPAAELGDGVTVGGIYSVISAIRDDGSGYASLSAPGKAELEEDGLSEGPMTQKFNREIKKVGASITKTAEEIRMEVQRLEESVNGKFESYSTRTQTAEMISEEVRKLSESINGTLEESYSTTTQTAELISSEVSKLEESINGTLEESYSTRTQTAEQIRDAVDGLVDGDYVSNSITTALEGLALEASSANGTTVLTLKGGEAVLSTKELKLSVDAAYITGSLTIGQLPEGVAQKSDIPDTSDFALADDVPTRLADLINAADDVTTIVKGTVTAKYINAMAITATYVSASGITTGTLDADFITLDGLMEMKNGNYYGYVGVNNAKGGAVLSNSDLDVFFIANDTTAKMSYMEENMIWVHSGGCYASETIQIYSDRTLKDNISYDLSVEEKLFGRLQPCSFSYISDKNSKKHWGFIAQDFIGGAQEVGMETDKLAVLGEYEGKYSIGYGEITALNTHMIQRLMSRVEALESRLEE